MTLVPNGVKIPIMVKIGEVFEEMVKHFNPSAAKGTAAAYQFEISGSEGGTWALDIKDGACNLVVGGVPSPSVTI